MNRRVACQRSRSWLSRCCKNTAFFCCGASLLAVATLLGCSGDATKATVMGTVTVDGKPAEAGAVTFIPVDGMAPTSGALIKAGKCTAQVPFGLAEVQIRVPKKIGERKLYDTPDNPVMPTMTESLPARYNTESELQLDVKPGVNQRDFKLESK